MRYEDFPYISRMLISRHMKTLEEYRYACKALDIPYDEAWALKKFTVIRIYPDGTKIWDFGGEWHRVDGPAFEWTSGSKEWFYEGKRHRVDGPAYEWADGSKEWWFEGKRHRVDGPAIECINGSKTWFYEGKLHRVDGPAFEDANRSNEWYFEGVKYTEEEWREIIKKISE